MNSVLLNEFRLWNSHLRSISKEPANVIVRVIAIKSSLSGLKHTTVPYWELREGKSFLDVFFPVCVPTDSLSRTTLSVDWWNHVTATPPCFYNSPKLRVKWNSVLIWVGVSCFVKGRMSNIDLPILPSKYRRGDAQVAFCLQNIVLRRGWDSTAWVWILTLLFLSVTLTDSI